MLIFRIWKEVCKEKDGKTTETFCAMLDGRPNDRMLFDSLRKLAKIVQDIVKEKKQHAEIIYATPCDLRIESLLPDFRCVIVNCQPVDLSQEEQRELRSELEK